MSTLQDINSEYKILTFNEKNERLDKYETIIISPKMWMLEIDDQEQFYERPYVRPLVFNIPEFKEMEKKFGRIEKLEHDFIADIVYGFLLADRHKEFFMLHLDQEDVVLHKAILTGKRESPEQDALFEGYWLIATPHRPLSWVDVEKSEVMVDMGEEYEILTGIKDAKKVEEIIAITLKEEVQNIPLKERQIFNIHEKRKTYFSNPIIHNTIVEYMKANDKTEQLSFYTFEEVLNKRGLL